MEPQNNFFHYTYSAKQQEEIQHIREKYLPKAEDKMEQLRRLDRSATKKGTIVSVALGVIGCLVMGIGMCCTMDAGKSSRQCPNVPWITGNLEL